MIKVEDKMRKQRDYKQFYSIIMDLFCKTNELEIVNSKTIVVRSSNLKRYFACDHFS